MKKKILVFMMLIVSVFSLSACGKSKINLADYLIEERTTLFTAYDEVYSSTLSSGLREKDYNFNGVVDTKVDFAILTLSRKDNQPLANDTYTFIVNINGTPHTGFLTKNETNNSYSTDLGIKVNPTDEVNVQISFTGYTFNQDLTNTSNSFNVDSGTALSIANKELAEEIKNITSDKNVKIEAVMKILKDNSNLETESYYWYVGVISTNGETLGILIDANTGDIIAKKV